SLQEGLCTSLLDALRCHLPLVGSRTGGIPEIVHDEETGLLAEPGDPTSLEHALRRLLSNADLREQLAEKGHRLAVDRFSVDHTVEGTLRVYRDLIREATS
ncbi:MAG: glycosyltransferase family 4 protein, partial [Planctomycetota bacterium]